MQVRALLGGRKSVEAGFAISAGCLVLNYDVDKTLEDTWPKLRRVSLSCFIVRPVADKCGIGRNSACVNNQRNTAVNSDQRKRALIGSVRNGDGSGRRSWSPVEAIFVSLPRSANKAVSS